ncbi:response regulator transcription factor [Deferrisoma palaeochoriense]
MEQKKVKVLAVDDEPNILLSLEYILEQEGFDVYTARDGDEALELAEKVRPDVVLLDVAMPRKDGYEVCRLLRGNQDLSGTRVVMLTAKGQPLERKKGLEVGADVYVTKPFATDELLEKIRKVLAG